MVGSGRLTRKPIRAAGRTGLVSQRRPVSLTGLTGLSGLVSPSGRNRGRSLI